MKYKSVFYWRLVLILSILLTGFQSAFAQGLVSIKKEIRDDGKAYVTEITNNLGVKVTVTLINDDGKKQSFGLNPAETKSPKLVCTLITYSSSTGGGTLWKKQAAKPLPQPVAEPTENEGQDVTEDSSTEPGPDASKERRQAQPAVVKALPQDRAVSAEEVRGHFGSYLESLPFYSTSSIEQEEADVKTHINNLNHWADRDAYMRDQRLNTFIRSRRDSISRYKEELTSMIDRYFSDNGGISPSVRDACYEELRAQARQRIEMRERNLSLLEKEINYVPEDGSFDWKELDWKIIGICVGLLILLIVLAIWYKKANKRDGKNEKPQDSAGIADASPTIVIRRKTTSILRKQSLEDVIDNSAYLRIDCNDFCTDSAVRRMYIKNTCIKDIYNMYAEDLRNPDNPKEDGCMVVGRWVQDKENDEYYVSLEQIVLPGDDAVFSEYELNFGGKIKLKLLEKLRKLRKDTGLQYDLTCWVHSHPGLGVFFSNSDCNVQAQLKHPTHPNFLTAIVVDILTPKQEFGIFTFKRDSTLNAKADLKKLYSLEELYQWAVESDRNSFKPEDYYNVLAGAKALHDDCHGIELSNGAIIDMGMLATEQGSGVVGMVHGFSNSQGQRTEHVAVTVSKHEAVPDNELIGCFIIATHCSIPTIRKSVAGYMGRIKFVLVYTTTDGLLTSIPVVNQDICIDENYYGEQKLEELKIWTRRKR